MGISKQMFMDLREEEFFRDRMYFQAEEDALFKELIKEDHEYRSQEHISSTRKSSVEKDKAG